MTATLTPLKGKRVTWTTILGLLLVPLTVAGVFLWGLWNPVDRLDTVTAAVVNVDEPVELDGQLVPLGRGPRRRQLRNERHYSEGLLGRRYLDRRRPRQCACGDDRDHRKHARAAARHRTLRHRHRNRDPRTQPAARRTVRRQRLRRHD